MKRKQPIEDSSQKMMKMSKTNKVMENIQTPVTRISNSMSRNFGYKLSDKRAKSNLLQGAAREPFEIVERQLSTILFFSAGSFLESVIPSVLAWKDGVKAFEVNDLSINIEEVLPGYDQDGKHMDTKVKFKVNSHKIVVCCYNTTMKIKVEGFGYFDFAHKYLKHLFTDAIRKAGAEKIENYNKSVIAALSGKRKAVTRPVRSVRYKAMAKVSCNNCDMSFSNNSQLSIHKRSNHTRGSGDKSANFSNIPIIDDLSLMDLSIMLCIESKGLLHFKF